MDLVNKSSWYLQQPAVEQERQFGLVVVEEVAGHAGHGLDAVGFLGQHLLVGGHRAVELAQFFVNSR